MNVEQENARALLYTREVNSNKGDFGTVLVIGGCRTMPGAPVLAALGALHSGAGLVRVAFPDCIYGAVTANLVESTFLPLESDEAGGISPRAADTLADAVSKADSVIFGCGAGTGIGVKEALSFLISSVQGTLIIDADGLNCLAKSPEILNDRVGETVLTPHPGEMARLLGCSVLDVNSNRTSTAVSFARKYGVTLLLKGHETVTSDKYGAYYVNTTGNSGLAKGGSGDLLSGIIGALATKIPPCDAAVLGAYIHGAAGDIGSSEHTEYSLTPLLCAEYIGKAFKSLL